MMYSGSHISIAQVANGWIVNVSFNRGIPVIEPDITDKMIEKIVALKEKMSRDPELEASGYYQESKPEMPEKPERPAPLINQIPKDESTFVFESFSQVLTFLSTLQ